MVEDIITELREVLRRDDNVLLAYLFGSRAKGVSSPISDYDLAVLLRNTDLKGFGEVLFAVSEVLKVREDRVDILDLKRAPLSLKARILKEGVKLVDRGCYEDELVGEVNESYPELSIEEAKTLNWWLNNPEGIDIRIIKERLDYVTELAHHISALLGRLGPDELSRDIEAWHALKSMVQDVAQAIIDVCAHVSTAKGLGAVAAYREYVEKLTESGLMDGSLAEDVKLTITLRNRLIHRYLTVTPEELWQATSKLTSNLIPRFREWALAVTKKSES